jgi:hypothetical protein
MSKLIRMRAGQVREGDTIVDRSNRRFDMYVEEVSAATGPPNDLSSPTPWVRLRNIGMTRFYSERDIVYVEREEWT